MKIPSMDLNEDIPYLDRSTFEEKSSGAEPFHISFRNLGYYIIRGAIHEDIVDSFKVNKDFYEDVAMNNEVYSVARSIIGDDVHIRRDNPTQFNWWCINGYVAMDNTNNLEVIPTSHKEFVGVVGDEVRSVPLKWTAKKGDVILLHVATAHRGDKNLFPLYYVARNFDETFPIKRVVNSGWKTINL